MKILFISDIHGSLGTLSTALSRGAALGMEHLVILGDELYHGPRNPLPLDYDPQEVIKRLNSLKDIITAVRGNCDAEVDQMVLDFPIEATMAIIEDNGVNFALTHGHVFNERNLPMEDWQVLALGHTHIGALDKLPGGRVLFNPGSLSLPKDGSPASFGFWEDGVLSLRELKTGNILKQISLFKH